MARRIAFLLPRRITLVVVLLLPLFACEYCRFRLLSHYKQPTTMPSSKKVAALKRLKEERARNELGLGGNKLDEYQVDDPGDVYDVVEEDYSTWQCTWP